VGRKVQNKQKGDKVSLGVMRISKGKMESNGNTDDRRAVGERFAHRERDWRGHEKKKDCKGKKVERSARTRELRKRQGQQRRGLQKEDSSRKNRKLRA